MISDALGMFADATSLTALSGTSIMIAPNTIDLVAARDVGRGQPVYVAFNITTTVSAAALTQMEFAVAVATTENLLTNTQVITKYGPVRYEQLTAGTCFKLAIGSLGEIGLDAGSPAYRRYLGVGVFNVASSVVSAGAFSARLTLDPGEGPTAPLYGSGFTVL